MLRTQLTKLSVIGHLLLPLSVGIFLTVMPLAQQLPNEVSESYFNFATQHSLGYPIFLQLIQIFSADPLSISIVQLWLFCATVFFLSLTLYRTTGSHFFAIFATLSLCINPYLINSHFEVLPDSLYVTISLLMFTFLISGVCSPGFLNLFGFGLMLGICMSIQPYGLAYLPLILIAAPLMIRRNHCGFLRAFFIPVVACLLITALEATTYQALHKEDDFRPAASHIFANAILMDTTQPSPYAPMDPRTGIWDKIENDLSAIRGQIWENSDFKQRQELLQSQEFYLSRDFAINALTQASFMLDKTVDDVRMDIAAARIIQAPLAFLEISINHYRRLWASDNLLSYPFWIISLLASVFGLLAWFRGTAFNAAFALAFCAGLSVQLQTILTAHTGVGHPATLLLLSPLMTLMIIGLLLGFYVSYINPPRTNG